MKDELIDKSTPILLTILCVFIVVIYFVDEPILDAILIPILSIALAAMGWIAYLLNREFRCMGKLAEDASNQCDRFSELYEAEVGKNMKLLKTIKKCTKEIEEVRGIIQKLS